MEYRVEKREAFRIVGVSHPLDRELEKNFEAVPRMWGQAAADGTIQRLAELMDSPPMGLLGVSACGYLGHLPGEGDRPVPSGFGTAYCHRMAAHLRV